MLNNPQLNGILFEKEVHKYLKLTNNIILSEREIRNKYGSNISGIDHLINTEEFIICIQDKYMKSKPSVSQINHFIYCVFEVFNKEKKKCIGIYLSNLPPTREASLSFENINNRSDKIYFKSINNSIDKLIDNLLDYLHFYHIFSYEEDGSSIMKSDNI
jgi:hypothetical protein